MDSNEIISSIDQGQNYLDGATPTLIKPILMDARELLDNPTNPEFLVHGLIEESTTGALIGASGSGKSFIALDLAASIATGRKFCNLPTKQGQVIYLAGEGRAGIARRLKAWEQANNTQIPDNKLLVSTNIITMDKEGSSTLIDAVSTLKLDNVSLLVIDTLARHMDGEENSNTDMGAFITTVDTIRDQLGCVALIVHHTGHGEGTKSRARGASSLRAALDFELLIENKNKHHSIKGTKDKERELWPIHYFNLESINIDEMKDFNGEPINSAVIEWINKENIKESTSMSSADYKALNEFKDALKDSDNNQSIELEVWRTYYYRTSTADSTNTKRTAFNRARKRLIDTGLAKVNNDVYTLITDT